MFDAKLAGDPVPVHYSALDKLDDTILELLPVAVYVCDAGGTVVRYNRRAADLWGRTPRPGDPAELFCGSHRLFRCDGRPLAHAETPMADAIRTGRPHRDVEVQVEQPGGHRIWILVNIAPIKAKSGEIIGAINCFQDISERKQNEERVRQSQELLHAVIETSPECVKIVAREGTLLHMNRAGLQMVEATATEEVEGRSVLDLIAPEHRDHWLAQHEQVCDGSRLSWEFDIVGLHGARRHMKTHAVPLTMPDGKIVQLAITVDISQRKRDEEALRESERGLRELLEALPTAVYTTDSNGNITFYNRAAVELSGREPELGKDQWCVTWRLYQPDGTPLPHDTCPMAVALKEGRAIHGAEIIAERPDGTRAPVLAYPTPLRDSAGVLTGAVNMLVDITDRKQDEERRQLLVNELNHRVKNTLATVQSIAAQSFRCESQSRAFAWFEGRLVTLSQAHDLLTRENWEGADLSEIVARASAPLCADDQDRFIFSGPALRVRPKMALSVSMALHELCTNAAKYGALSNETGHVNISWDLVEDQADGRLRLQWEECGGPPVVAPQHKGFGSRLITRGLAHELGAKVQLDYPPSGVVCTIEAPL